MGKPWSRKRGVKMSGPRGQYCNRNDEGNRSFLYEIRQKYKIRTYLSI